MTSLPARGVGIGSRNLHGGYGPAQSNQPDMLHNRVSMLFVFPYRFLVRVPFFPQKYFLEFYNLERQWQTLLDFKSGKR